MLCRGASAHRPVLAACMHLPFIVHSPPLFICPMPLPAQDSAAAPLTLPLFDTYRAPDRPNLCRTGISHYHTRARRSSGIWRRPNAVAGKYSRHSCDLQPSASGRRSSWHETALLGHTGMACGMAVQGCAPTDASEPLLPPRRRRACRAAGCGTAARASRPALNWSCRLGCSPRRQPPPHRASKTLLASN